MPDPAVPDEVVQAADVEVSMPYPDHPVIDVWAVVCDPDVPADVIERLVGRQAARKAGRTPAPVPAEDKPYLARHIVKEGERD